MQQGFGVILLADEVMRERRAAEMADARRARDAREAREATRPLGQGVRRPRRFAVRVPRFVVALTLLPTGRGAEAE
jgi:hypothetical protein